MDCYLLAVGTMNELGLKPSKELPVPRRTDSLVKNFSTSRDTNHQTRDGEEGRKDPEMIMASAT